MAERTTQKSGNASDSTVWDGGTALADRDSITIAAGHTLTWDMNQTQCDAFQVRLAAKAASLTTMLNQVGE